MTFARPSLATHDKNGACGGCAAWVQGSEDLDPVPLATAQVFLPGTPCNGIFRLETWPIRDGTCSPGTGTSCTEPLDPCVFRQRLTYRVPPGVQLFINDGTYGVGLAWEPLFGGSCTETVELRERAIACGSASFVWIVAWDPVTGVSDFDFVTLGAKACPLPD